LLISYTAITSKHVSCTCVWGGLLLFLFFIHTYIFFSHFSQCNDEVSPTPIAFPSPPIYIDMCRKITFSNAPKICTSRLAHTLYCPLFRSVWACLFLVYVCRLSKGSKTVDITMIIRLISYISSYGNGKGLEIISWNRTRKKEQEKC